jgi:hypothetical protein
VSPEGDSPEAIRCSVSPSSSNASFEWTDIAPSSKTSPKSTAMIPRQFSTPLDERASCYFMANFVLVPNENSMKGYLEFLLPLLKKSQESHLMLTFTAVALAA